MDPEDLTTLELHDEDPPEPALNEPAALGTKRPLETEGTMADTGDEKRHAGSPEVLLRLLCPGALTGAIIGKGGEAINLMRTETGCKIHVEHAVPGCQERIINISAEDAPSQAVCPSQSALLRVVEKLKEAAQDGQDEEAFTIRLLAFKSQIGGVIGKGGHIISELRSSTGAQIRVMPKHEVPSCASADDEVVQVIGNYGRVHHAVQEISSKLRENPQKEKPSAGGRRAPPPPQQPQQLQQPMMGGAYGMPQLGMNPHMAAQHHPGAYGAVPAVGGGGSETLLRMVLPVVKAGTVIGRGGEAIRRVREETGAKVAIHDAVPGVDFRIVEISSLEPPSSMFCAAQEALLRCYHLSSADEPTGTAKLVVSHSSVGAILGKGGSVIKALRQETGATIRVFGKDSSDLPQGLGPDDEMVQVDGNPYAVDAAIRGVVMRIRSSAKPAAAGQQHPPHGAPAPQLNMPYVAHGGAPIPGAHYPAPGANDGPQESVTLQISKDVAGGIIGKGGSNIAQIRQISGAQVHLHSDADPQTGERPLEIKGTTQQVQSAQSLVQAFLYSTGHGSIA